MTKTENKFTGQIAKQFQPVNLSLNELNSTEQKINPDSLLTDADKIKPDTNFDCGVDLGKTRKACKGCTCGLADELENEAKEKIKQNIVSGQTKSSCGSCYLGDAFRCSTCPFKGMPAYDKGNPPVLTGVSDFAKIDE